ncbi:MAG: SCO family protein [Candidatus Eremiobacteraeota bacterium]|nr:SCO family protein [Candidatus Eremiobacteraeota bacterium]
MNALLTVLLCSVVPVHGLVLATLPDHAAIVRTDAVVDMFPAQTQRYRLPPNASFRAGTTIDALLDLASRPIVLRDPVAAAAFAPGLPDAGRAVRVVAGGLLPAATLVDQEGRVTPLDSAFRGKTLLLSFVFTRCPDRTLCPAISGKFAYLQQHLDPKRFVLAEITLDPQYDSPAVLRKYGAMFGVQSQSWRLLTGTGSTIARLLDAFTISSMRVSDDNFLHDDRLFLVTPAGRVAYVVETGSWDPASVIAQAQAISGLASDPFERFKLALIAHMVALCGGSESGGIVLLELSLFALLTAASFAALWVVARVIW